MLRAKGDVQFVDSGDHWRDLDLIARIPILERWAASLQLLLFVILFSIVASVGVDTAAQESAEWDRFLGPTQNNKSDAKGILKDWSDDKLKVLWKFPLSESYGICSIQDGLLYQFDRIDGKEVLICLDAETGKENWRQGYAVDYLDLYGYNRGPRCSPILDEEFVYTFGVTGVLYCRNKQTGEVVWQVDTSEKYGVVQNFFGVGSTPVIHNNLLIVMVGGSPEESQSIPPGRLDLVKPNGTCIVAFEKGTGKEVYRLGDDLASYSSLRTATINDRSWCFAFAREKLLGFDPSSGKLDFEFAWRARTLESVNASVPVVFDDRVFISETYGPGSCVLKVSPGKSEIVWQDDLRKREKAMQTHWNTAVYHEGFLYGSSGRHSYNAELRCVEAETGEVMWSEPGLGRCSLLYVDDHFVVLSETGTLLLVKATEDGYQKVTETTLMHRPDSRTRGGDELVPLVKAPAWAAPILWNNKLYVRGDDYLVCLALIPE